jgi:hypothetical protein
MGQSRHDQGWAQEAYLIGEVRQAVGGISQIAYTFVAPWNVPANARPAGTIDISPIVGG